MKFQPILACDPHSIPERGLHPVFSHECLSRPDERSIGSHGVARFFRDAEKNGSIVQMDLMHVKHVAQMLRGGELRQYAHQSEFAVNISGITASDPANWQVISQALRGRSSERALFDSVRVEITETAPFDMFTAASAIREARQEGLSVVADDAGTGYATVDRLAAWPEFDCLKTDILMLLPENADRMKGVISLAAERGISVVFEGVETPDHLSRIYHLVGVHGGGIRSFHAQGFFIGEARTKPQIAVNMNERTACWLRRNDALPAADAREASRLRLVSGSGSDLGM